MIGDYKCFIYISLSLFFSSEMLEIEGSDLGPFYSQLKIIKDFHRRQPQNSMAVDFIEIESILNRVKVSNNNLNSIFTGEERNGRFLDLYRLYDEAINFNNNEISLDYLTFLQIFDRPSDYVPESKRSSAAYSNYLDNLFEYLIDFVQRTRPISGLNQEEPSLKELEDRHKLEVEEILNSKQDFNLFCGPCDKLFTNVSVFEAHFKGKKHLKAVESAEFTETTKSTSTISSEAKEKLVEQRLNELKKRQSIEIKEHLISLYGEILKEVKESTKGNVERRQALTAEERLEFEVESDFEEETSKNENNEESVVDDGRIYNPLKLPLDWDGKPIPFWLWKLHGLGVQFSCEICGNYVYMGRRAFDQHFYEWRHSHGMKCLGIPNTSHFFQITKIEEVKRLWEKMRQTAKIEALRADWMEECEDSSGNVYDRRTFEDLKRQGLI